MVSKSCFKCTKYLLFIDSIVICLIGCVVLGFNLWMYLDPHRNFMLDIVNTSEGDPLLLIAVIILIAMGCLTIVIGILGCIGTVREAPCLLIAFLTFLTIVIVGQIAAGSLAAVFKAEVDERFQDKFRDMVRNKYGRVRWVETVVDKIQYFGKCCGADSRRDYELSYYQLQATARRDGFVHLSPESCCEQNDQSWWNDLKPINQETCLYTREPNPSRYENGCYETFMTLFAKYSFIFIGVAIGAALLELFGVILAMVLVCDLRIAPVFV